MAAEEGSAAARIEGDKLVFSTDVAGELGVTRQSIYNLVSCLRRSGVPVERLGRGLYAVPLSAPGVSRKRGGGVVIVVRPEGLGDVEKALASIDARLSSLEEKLASLANSSGGCDCDCNQLRRLIALLEADKRSLEKQLEEARSRIIGLEKELLALRGSTKRR